MDMLWTDFLNSHWHDWRGSGRSEDRLEQEPFLTRFLAAHGLHAPVPPSPAELASLLAFREQLRAMARNLAAGARLPPEDLEVLNLAMAAGPVVRRVAPEGPGYRLESAAVRQDWAQVIAEVAAAFARTLTEGEGSRVRICDNPDCLWVFYDETRNRAKRFCSDKECGNLMKVRRFRARQKEGPAPGEQGP